jgi:phosphoglycerate kinase
MQDGKITDQTRVRESLPTIKYALEQGAKLVLASHLGRPKSSGDRQYSLLPVAQLLQELLAVEVILVEEPNSDAPKALLAGLKRKQLLLLENLRFDPGEAENSTALAEVWASYSDVYINDAFGASHRAHASIEALPRLLKSNGIGFLIEKEIQILDQLIGHPERPYVAVMGGSKVSDKIGVIDKLLEQVDVLMIGGAMAYTFLKANGIEVGSSRVEADKVSHVKDLMRRMQSRGKSLLLPVDHVVASDIKSTAGRITESAAIGAGEMGVDIGPKTIQLFAASIREAKTVFWNGPMGVFENPAFAKGSFAISQILADSKAPMRVVGGGDSAAAVEASGFASKMTHISTGGGASLEYIQGDKLPGLEVLRHRREGVEPVL